MMLNFFRVGAFALAWAPCSSVAQGVDFHSFDRVQHSFILNSVKPEPSYHPDVRQLDPLPLAIDFRDLSTNRPEGAFVLPNGPAGLPHIPRWMRATRSDAATGSPRSFPASASAASFSHLANPIPAGCQYEAYRPKGLHPKVEMRRARYYSLMVATACRVGVPVTLFDALITQESGYDPAALSVKGAIGMSQLMPATARFAGVSNPWDVAENLRGGALVLKAHLAEFGRFDLALAAYNAGAGRVRRQGRVPHIKETANYVSSILSDVRHQYAQAIGIAGIATMPSPPIRNASFMRF